MTPDRLSACLAVIRWKPVTLARAVDVPLSAVERWLAGTTAIPRAVASWIEALSFLHETAEQSKPATAGEGFVDVRLHLEHIPVYAYHLLRRLGVGPVALTSLYGTDDEGAVFFVVSRGLATREDNNLTITPAGRSIGEVTRSDNTPG
ncbi:MAG TPA: hypothetical protein VHB23_13905 [Devosiaceae bacterium]|jgi:hypothetical protein|nr:hypothetical protein [Devosiaceae bacterium]